jgi:3',5'-cyclic-AMP phosphodiesterase
MRLLWLTDIHLNFLRPANAAQTFGACLGVEHDFDRIVITGDIAEAPTVRDLLCQFARGAGRPIDFVLGNHDYYGGSIAEVDKQMLEGLEPNLNWLDNSGPVLLDEDTALVGQGGWYDARLGKPRESRVVMSDWTLIKDFRSMFQEMFWVHYEEQGSRVELLCKLQKLSREHAQAAKLKLLEALKLRKQVIFATHYPPFKKACWHEGNISNDHWLPWFTCGAIGQMLGQLASDHPDHKILVLCGHTHSPGEYQHSKNLRVLTGKAVYGAPDVAGLLTNPFDGWPEK